MGIWYMTKYYTIDVNLSDRLPAAVYFFCNLDGVFGSDGCGGVGGKYRFRGLTGLLIYMVSRVSSILNSVYSKGASLMRYDTIREVTQRENELN